MMDVLLQFMYEFLRNDFKKAYRLTKLTMQLEPFYSGEGFLDRYVAAKHDHHVATKSKKEIGLTDWYEALGIPHDSPEKVVNRCFVKMGKLIDPDYHCSATTKGAYVLISRAVEVWDDSMIRASYDSYWK